MAFLRSAFVTVFMAYLVGTFAYTTLQLIRHVEPALSWFGLALASLGPLAFFGWIFAAKPVRTDRHPVGFSVLSGLGLAITMAMSWRHGDAAGIVHIWAAVVLVSWMIYLNWYSPFKNRDAPSLVPGQALPEFELQNTAGHMVKSSHFQGRSNIWLFYRGNWCPFCTAQISELAQKYREIEKTGTGILLISPQDLDKHQKLAARFDSPMQFLRDPGNQAAKKLGIFDAWGTPLGMQALGYDSDTVLPTMIITDSSGRIIYAHQTDHYRIRPGPDEFLKVLAGSES